jgi:hypothetical protein
VDPWQVGGFVLVPKLWSGAANHLRDGGVGDVEDGRDLHQRGLLLVRDPDGLEQVAVGRRAAPQRPLDATSVDGAEHLAPFCGELPNPPGDSPRVAPRQHW